ncbi:hypothetical protein D3C73_651340 [compost metagenome]
MGPQEHKADSPLISTMEFTATLDQQSGRLILIHCYVNGRRKSGYVSGKEKSRDKKRCEEENPCTA